jgi:hypothetical protein
MRDFQLVENDNNLELIDKDFQITDNLSRYVSQKLRIRLSFFRGEWYLNINKGIPYFESVFVKDPNISFIEDLIVLEITTCPYIEELLELNLTVEKSTRELIINFKARLENGEIISETI